MEVKRVRKQAEMKVWDWVVVTVLTLGIIMGVGAVFGGATYLVAKAISMLVLSWDPPSSMFFLFWMIGGVTVIWILTSGRAHLSIEFGYFRSFKAKDGGTVVKHYVWLIDIPDEVREGNMEEVGE